MLITRHGSQGSFLLRRVAADGAWLEVPAGNAHASDLCLTHCFNAHDCVIVGTADGFFMPNFLRRTEFTCIFPSSMVKYQKDFRKGGNDVKRFWMLATLIILLAGVFCLPAAAETAATQVDIQSTVTSDGDCLMTVTVNLRLEAAMLLLRQSDTTLTDAAYACGFSDPKYLNQSFLKNLGMTPRQWLQENRPAPTGETQSKEDSRTAQHILTPDECRALLDAYGIEPDQIFRIFSSSPLA